MLYAVFVRGRHLFMNKIRVGFRAIGEVNIFSKKEITEMIYDAVLEIMLNNVFTEFYLLARGELDVLAENALLHKNNIVKFAKRKQIIKVLPRGREISKREISPGIDDIITIDKDYDDWLLEKCDVIIGDDSKEFHDSELAKKAKLLNKKIINLYCGFTYYFL